MAANTLREINRSRSAATRNVFRGLAITAALRTLTSTAYLVLRTKYTLKVQHAFAPFDLLIAWTFLLIEIGCAVTHLDSNALAIGAGGKLYNRPPLPFEGSLAPSVDVFIFYCGESLNVLLDTVRAACALQYPHEKLRVLVLDDSDSSDTKRAILELATGHPNLQYTSRGGKVDDFTKAANFNHGLRFSRDLAADGKGSDLIAGLDVDMIPEPEWLRTLVPNVMADDQVAMSSVHQSFYNVLDGDPLGRVGPLNHHFRLEALQMDAMGTAIASGTGFVARRTAIDQIGGIPEKMVTEDVATCLKLGRAGWKIVCIDEDLQWGLMSDSFAGHLKQERRWAAGGLEVIEMLGQAVSKSSGWELGISSLIFFALPTLLMSNRALVLQENTQQLESLLTLAVIDLAAQVVDGALQVWQTRSIVQVFHRLQSLWIQVYLLPLYVSHWAPKWVVKYYGSLPKFTTGGSAASRSLEFELPYSHSLLPRLKLILWDHGALVHLLSLIGTLIGISRTLQNMQDIEGLLVRGGWPTAVLLWTSLISNAWVPFKYAIFPPPKPRREELLVRHPISKVVYPSQEAKQRSKLRIGQWQASWVVAYMFTAVSFLYIKPS